jgi:hypothetical protein
MRYFLDTEFMESGRDLPIRMISIGIVAEDGREYYAINGQARTEDANDWVKQNVLPLLAGPRKSEALIKQEILQFIGGDEKPEFWGYYSAYDWVVFCQLFGAMVDLPHGWPMYCRDLKQWADMIGNPRFAKPAVEHNALSDARWNAEFYTFLAQR